MILTAVVSMKPRDTLAVKSLRDSVKLAILPEVQVVSNVSIFRKKAL